MIVGEPETDEEKDFVTLVVQSGCCINFSLCLSGIKGIKCILHPNWKTCKFKIMPCFIPFKMLYRGCLVACTVGERP